MFLGGVKMPWTPKQHRLFCKAASDKKLAQRLGMSQDKARKMCREGIVKKLAGRKK